MDETEADAGELTNLVMIIDSDGRFKQQLSSLPSNNRWIYVNVVSRNSLEVHSNSSHVELNEVVNTSDRIGVLKLYRVIEHTLRVFGIPDLTHCLDYNLGHYISLYLLETRGLPYIADSLNRMHIDNHFYRWPIVFSASLLFVDEQQQVSSFLAKNFIRPLLSESAQKLSLTSESYDAVCRKSRRYGADKNATMVKQKRVLIVSYFSEPFLSVGTLRNDYWKEVLPTISDYHVDFVTAINQFNQDGRSMSVPDFGVYSIGAEHAEVQELNRMNASSIDSLGYTWVGTLERFYREREDLSYHLVLMTGNPFLHFRFAKFAREAWDAKIVFDYRDPYSNHPRIMPVPETRVIERSLNQMADGIVTVNKVCADLVETTDKNKIRIIPNGYDERFFEKAPALQSDPSQLKKIVYAGSISQRFNVAGLFSHASEWGLELHVFGRCNDNFIQDVTDNRSVTLHGVIPYPELCEALFEYDAGLIFTTGDKFESTTKIFDYIAADLSIIIVTDGELFVGELHEITKDMAGVYWVKNDPNTAGQEFRDMNIVKINRSCKMEHSRLTGARSLVSFLDTLSSAE